VTRILNVIFQNSDTFHKEFRSEFYIYYLFVVGYHYKCLMIEKYKYNYRQMRKEYFILYYVPLQEILQTWQAVSPSFFSSESISDVSAVGLLATTYVIPKRKGELFFSFVLNTNIDRKSFCFHIIMILLYYQFQIHYVQIVGLQICMVNIQNNTYRIK
jgi:hypothetical protein